MAVHPRQEPSSASFAVAGIGASAGGITALQALFAAIPAAPDLAIVVVQHRLPHEDSRLSDLLSRWTPMPVRDARAGEAVGPGCVYVAPATQIVTLEGGRFAMRPIEEDKVRPGNYTIDAFLESLAADMRERAIAVVLSGTGADGAAGAVRVKQAGGQVLVQDPLTAMHDGMPSAAIATGAVDKVMPLAALAGELVACASPSHLRSGSRDDWDEAGPALAEITEVLRARTGLDLAAYKTAPLLWRIQRRMEQRRVPTFRDYALLLRDDPLEVEALVRAIPIHVTEFFRDPEAWEALQREVVPRLFGEAGEAGVRAWTAACATGQEAYSLAMLLAEHAEALEPPGKFQVFATDAASEIVARAGRGAFSAGAMKGVSPQRLQRFFYAADGAFRVKRELREKMVFAPQDLLADPPFTGLDLVTCRNLLIYLDATAVRRVLHLLHASLRMGGYLMVGRSEALAPGQRDGFTEVAPFSRIYRKTGPASREGIEFPRRPVRLASAASTGAVVQAVAHEAAIEEGVLPSLLLDEHLHILRVHGDTARFLRFKPGEPTLDARHLAIEGVHLEHAARKALADGAEVTVGGLRDPVSGERTLELRVTPMHAAEGAPRLLVSFNRGPGAAAADVAAARDAAGWTAALRASDEELDASREELQALNEELRSSNDQLNLANDSLEQANTDLLGKVAELQTQSDVLSSGAVMALFLDEGLRVRWFTPAVTQLFPLRPGDIGRAITDLTPRFEAALLHDDIQAVLRNGETREAEVRNREGSWYLYRVRPFRTGIERAAASGVAITFDDITDRVRAAEERTRVQVHAAQAERLAERLIERMGDAHCVLDRELRIVRVNAAAERALGMPRSRLIGRSHREVFPASGDAPVGRAITRVVAEGIEQHLTHHDTGGGHDMHIELDAYPTEEGGVAMSWRDVTERVRAEDALRRSEERYRLLFENMNEGFALAEMIWDEHGAPIDWRYLEVNPAWEQTGVPVAATVGRTAREVNPDIEPYWIETFGRVVRTGEAVRYENYAAGFGKWFETFAFKHSENRFGLLLRDVTERHKPAAAAPPGT